MLVGEFNTNDIAYLLLGICINSDREKINKETKSIIKKDLITYKPTTLYNAYTIKEFRSILELHKQKSNTIKLREIIPNNYGIGLVREVGFDNTPIEELLSNVFKQFKYYCIINVVEGRDIIVTYNPEAVNMKKVKLKLKNGMIVKCTTLQAGQNKQKQEYEVISCSESEDGKLIIYDIDFKDLEGGIQNDINGRCCS